MSKDLQIHTLKFAQAVREFGKVLPRTVSNVEDLKELIRASGSVGATYIAALESVNKQDYLIRIKACGRDLKTTQYWLQLIDTQGSGELDHRRTKLVEAAHELDGVFQTILKHSAETKS